MRKIDTVGVLRAEGGKSGVMWISLTLLTLAALGALDRLYTQPTAASGLIFIGLVILIVINLMMLRKSKSK
jgi:hypothetical protein